MGQRWCREPRDEPGAPCVVLVLQRAVRVDVCDGLVRSCVFVGWEPSLGRCIDVGARCTCGVLGSGGRNPGKREEMMWPQQWGDVLVHQRLRDSRGVCVPRVSQVVRAVPVSIRVRTGLGVLVNAIVRSPRWLIVFII